MAGWSTWCAKMELLNAAAEERACIKAPKDERWEQLVRVHGLPPLEKEKLHHIGMAELNEAGHHLHRCILMIIAPVFVESPGAFLRNVDITHT